MPFFSWSEMIYFFYLSIHDFLNNSLPNFRSTGRSTPSPPFLRVLQKTKFFIFVALFLFLHVLFFIQNFAICYICPAGPYFKKQKKTFNSLSQVFSNFYFLTPNANPGQRFTPVCPWELFLNVLQLATCYYTHYSLLTVVKIYLFFTVTVLLQSIISFLSVINVQCQPYVLAG